MFFYLYEVLGPGREDLVASGRCGVRVCLICLKTMRWIYKNNKKLYRFKK